MNKLIIYLVGAVRTDPNAEKKFQDAENKIRKVYPDAYIINPIKEVAILKENMPLINEYKIMGRLLIDILFYKPNYIVVIDQNSENAKLEVKVAEVTGKKVIKLEDVGKGEAEYD